VEVFKRRLSELVRTAADHSHGGRSPDAERLGDARTAL
jgi:hypothetical protein